MTPRRIDVPKPGPAAKAPLPAGMGAILEFTAGEDAGVKVPLFFTRTVLGRKFGDILVRDLNVSATHAAVEYRGGGFGVTDLDSSNGTVVSGRKVKRAPIALGEEVRIGSTAFRVVTDPKAAARLAASRPRETVVFGQGLSEVLQKEFFGESAVPSPKHPEKRDVIELAVLSGPDRFRQFSFRSDSVAIGRIGTDVVLRDPDVSRKHALIERQEGGAVVLRDLASRNGTFVNGRRVADCVIREGDRIRVGATSLLYGPAPGS